MDDAGQTSPAAAAPLAAGSQAPDFTLHTTPDQTVSLREFRGQPVILAFYPADWSPVCGDQMALYNEILPGVPAPPARSCSASRSTASGATWPSPRTASSSSRCSRTSSRRARCARVRRVPPPGRRLRARAVRDRRRGVIRWSYVSPIGVNPGADGILTALEALSP